MAYCITKFRDTSDAVILAYGGNGLRIILRYADVILMMAGFMKLWVKKQKAISYLDEVREGQDYQVILNLSKIPTTEVNIRLLKLAILHERRVELAFENQRWYDFTPFLYD